jgi:hypothetical protein
MPIQTTRREFLAGAAAALTILPNARMVRGSQANERLNLAMLGTMYNAAHMQSAPHLYNAPIVALCEPDQRNLAKVFEGFKATAKQLETAKDPMNREWAAKYRKMAEGQNVKVYADTRRLFDEMEDAFDALVVSHYDHLHGVACGPALRAKKPVLSERPLGLTVAEARALRELAAKARVPTTYRSPGTAAGPFRRAMELVEEGAIGQVREVHVWFKRGGPDRDSLPMGPKPVPAELNWDAWLGPLPWREYHPDWQAYSHWRETCNGGLGVFGPHASIFPFMTLELGRLWDQGGDNSRIKVAAKCARQNLVSFPRWERIQWSLPARSKWPPVEITWHHGPDLAPGSRELLYEKLRAWGIKQPAEAEALMKDAGSLLVGSEGAMVADDHSVKVTALPKEKFEAVEVNRPLRIAESRNLYRDWIDACRGEHPQILANFENGGRLSELLMIGNIATLFPEEPLTYDPSSGRIIDKAEANTFLARDYRAGWRL